MNYDKYYYYMIKIKNIFEFLNNSFNNLELMLFKNTNSNKIYFLNELKDKNDSLDSILLNYVNYYDWIINNKCKINKNIIFPCVMKTNNAILEIKNKNINKIKYINYSLLCIASDNINSGEVLIEVNSNIIIIDKLSLYRPLFKLVYYLYIKENFSKIKHDSNINKLEKIIYELNNYDSYNLHKIFPGSIINTISLFFECLIKDKSYYYPYLKLMIMNNSNMLLLNTDKDIHKKSNYNYIIYNYSLLYDKEDNYLLNKVLKRSFNICFKIIKLFLKKKIFLFESDLVLKYSNLFDLFKNIYSYVESRQFIAEGNYKDNYIYKNETYSMIIPLADSLNHSDCNVEYILKDNLNKSYYGKELFNDEDFKLKYDFDIKDINIDSYYEKYKYIDDKINICLINLVMKDKRSIIYSKFFKLINNNKYYNSILSKTKNIKIQSKFILKLFDDSNDKDYFVIKTCKNNIATNKNCIIFKKNDEVFNNYGDYDNEHFLKYYNFVPLNLYNKNNICKILINVNINLLSEKNKFKFKLIKKHLKSNVIYINKNKNTSDLKIALLFNLNIVDTCSELNYSQIFKILSKKLLIFNYINICIDKKENINIIDNFIDLFNYECLDFDIKSEILKEYKTILLKYFDKYTNKNTNSNLILDIEEQLFIIDYYYKFVLNDEIEDSLNNKIFLKLKFLKNVNIDVLDKNFINILLYNLTQYYILLNHINTINCLDH